MSPSINWKSQLAQFAAIENFSMSSITKVVFSGELKGVMFVASDNYRSISPLAHHELNREIRMMVDVERGLITRSTDGYNRSTQLDSYTPQDVEMGINFYRNEEGLKDLYQEWDISPPAHVHDIYGIAATGAGAICFKNENRDSSGQYISTTSPISFNKNPSVLQFCKDWCETRGLVLDEGFGFGNSVSTFDPPFIGGVAFYKDGQGSRPSLFFKVMGDYPMFRERVMAFQYSSAFKSFAMHGDETAWNGVGFDDLSAFKVETREPAHSEDVIRWYPLTGPWGLVDLIKGRVSFSSEEVVSPWLEDGAAGTTQLRVANVEVREFHGVISRDDIVAYNNDCFGVAPSNQEMKLSSFWDNFPFVEFSRCDLPTFDTRSVNVSDLKIARDYNKSRKKACKSENFLETSYNDGYTWGQVQDRIQQINHRTHIWMSELGSNSLVEWFDISDQASEEFLTCSVSGDVYTINVGLMSLTATVNDTVPLVGSPEFEDLSDFLASIALVNWKASESDKTRVEDMLDLINARIGDDEQLMLHSLKYNLNTQDGPEGESLDSALRDLGARTRSGMGLNFESGSLLPYSGKIASGDPIIMLAARQVTSFQHAGNSIKSVIEQLLSPQFLAFAASEQRKLLEVSAA